MKMDYGYYKYFKTEEEALQALDNRCDFKHVVFEPFRDNLNVAKRAMKTTEQNFIYLGDGMKDNEEIVRDLFTCGKATGPYLGHCSDRIRDTDELVLLALKSCPLRGQKEDVISYYASARIKDLCDGKDPVKALEAAILAEKLTKDLQAKPASRSGKLKI